MHRLFLMHFPSVVLPRYFNRYSHAIGAFLLYFVLQIKYVFKDMSFSPRNSFPDFTPFRSVPPKQTNFLQDYTPIKSVKLRPNDRLEIKTKHTTKEFVVINVFDKSFLPESVQEQGSGYIELEGGPNYQFVIEKHKPAVLHLKNNSQIKQYMIEKYPNRRGGKSRRLKKRKQKREKSMRRQQ